MPRPSRSKKQPDTPAITGTHHFKPKAKIFPQEQDDSAADATTRLAMRQALANLSGFVYKPTYEHHDLRSKPQCRSPQLLPSDAKMKEEEERQKRMKSPDEAMEASEDETELSDEEIEHLLHVARRMKEEDQEQRVRDIEASKEKLKHLFDAESDDPVSVDVAVPSMPGASPMEARNSRPQVVKKRAKQKAKKKKKKTTASEKTPGVGVARDVPVVIGWPAGVKMPDKLRTSFGRDEVFSTSHAVKIAHRPNTMADLLSEGHELTLHAEAPAATTSSPTSSTSKGSTVTRIPRPKANSVLSSARSAVSDDTVLTMIPLHRRRTDSSSITAASRASSSPLLFLGPPMPEDSDSDNEDALSISTMDDAKNTAEDEAAPDEFTKLLASDLVHPWPNLWEKDPSGWSQDTRREDEDAYDQVRQLLIDVWMALTGQKKATQEVADVFASMLPDNSDSNPSSKRSSKDSVKKRFSRDSFKLKRISSSSAKVPAVDDLKTLNHPYNDSPLGSLALKSPMDTRLSFGSNKSVIASFDKRHSGNTDIESLQPSNISQRSSGGHGGIFSPINAIFKRKEGSQPNLGQRNSCPDSIFSTSQPVLARKESNLSFVRKVSSGDETITGEKSRGPPMGNLHSRKPNLTIRTSKSSTELRSPGLEGATSATETATPTKRSRFMGSLENLFTPKKSSSTARGSFEADDYFATTPFDAPPVPKLPPEYAHNASQISTPLPSTPNGSFLSHKTSRVATPVPLTPGSARFKRSMSQLSTCTTVPPSPGSSQLNRSTSQLSTEVPPARGSSLFHRSTSQLSTIEPTTPGSSFFGRSTPNLAGSIPPTPGSVRSKSRSFTRIFRSLGGKKKEEEEEEEYHEPLTHVDPAIFEELLEELIVSFTNWHNSNMPTSFPLTGLAVQAARALVAYTSTILESLHDFDDDCDNIDHQHARLIWITENLDVPLSSCPFEKAPEMSPEYIAAGHCDVWAMKFLAWAEEQDELVRYIEHDVPATFFDDDNTENIEKDSSRKTTTADGSGSPRSRAANRRKGLDAPGRCETLKRRLDWCEIDSRLATHLNFDGPLELTTAEVAEAGGEGRPLTAAAARKRFEALVHEVGNDARWAVCAEQIARLAGLVGRDAIAGMEAKRLVKVWEEQNEQDRVERKKMEKKRRQEKATKMMMVGMGRRGMGVSRAAGDSNLKIKKREDVVVDGKEKERKDTKEKEKKDKERERVEKKEKERAKKEREKARGKGKHKIHMPWK
ncbi:hypothetical protein BC567DRAFT_295293 [Phyllosticta citribraziliensis]